MIYALLICSFNRIGKQLQIISFRISKHKYWRIMIRSLATRKIQTTKCKRQIE